MAPKPLEHMRYSKESWVETFKKTVSDLNTNEPTSGLPCALAGIRYIRDHLLGDHTKQQDGKAKVVQITEATIRESFKELIKQLGEAGKVSEGFLSNASAAAKAAGFENTVSKLNKLVE